MMDTTGEASPTRVASPPPERTHYRLTLTKGRGKNMIIIAERHSYSKTPPSGWWRSVKLLGSSIHVRVCWTPDEACEALAKPGGAP